MGLNPGEILDSEKGAGDSSEWGWLIFYSTKRGCEAV